MPKSGLKRLVRRVASVAGVKYTTALAFVQSRTDTATLTDDEIRTLLGVVKAAFPRSAKDDVDEKIERCDLCRRLIRKGSYRAEIFHYHDADGRTICAVHFGCDWQKMWDARRSATAEKYTTGEQRFNAHAEWDYAWFGPVWLEEHTPKESNHE